MRLPFSFGREQVHRNKLAEPGAPPDHTATVAKVFCCFSRRGEVSTVLPNSPRTSLSYSIAFYRALVAGPRSAMAAARHSRGRGGRERVEHVLVLAIGSRRRGEAAARARMG